MAIEKLTNGTCQQTTTFLSGQPLIETWVAHGQPYAILDFRIPDYICNVGLS
jgi:hypothetical protein